MGRKKMFVLLGHPDKSGFYGEMADAYCESALAAGHTVERLDLGGMRFDPILHHGYRERHQSMDGLALTGQRKCAAQMGILWFAGFSVHTTWFGSSENIPAARKAKWLRRVRQLGHDGR